MLPNHYHRERVEFAVLQKKAFPSRSNREVVAFEAVEHGFVCTDGSGAFSDNDGISVDEDQLNSQFARIFS